MKIQELERLVGTDRATIRYYEKEGLIAPKRQDNGYRDYSEDHAEELKKIRLLRQLGLSIEKIRSLQQGGEDFRAVMSAQIAILTDQIAESKRARKVCLTMQNDAVLYETLDADHYLKLLTDPQIEDHTPVNKEFQEDLPEEIHPWRRFFARMFDYFLLNVIINFMIVVVFRVRPLPGDFMGILITVFSGALYVPLEAWMLSKWATTPGKFIFAIRVEAAEGGKLDFWRAFERAKSVYVQGMFLRLPILMVGAAVWRYCQLTGRSFRRFARHDEIHVPEQMVWDHGTELSYDRWNWKRGVALAVSTAFGVILVTTTAIDSVRPKYRGSELTITQFAENYNFYLELLNEDAPIYDKLQPDGKKYPVPNGIVAVNLNSLEHYKPLEYEYALENEYLRSVSFHYQEEKLVFYFEPVNMVFDVVVPIYMAQKGATLEDLQELENQVIQCFDQEKGTITYRNSIQVEWEIITENCKFYDGIYYPDVEEKSTLDFHFSVTILN